MLVATHLVFKERLSCSFRLILFWTISNSPELGLTSVFVLQMERTTVDNSEHDYTRWRITAPKTENMNCKKTVKQNRNPIRLRILPFNTIIFTTAFKSIQIVGWFSQNHKTATPHYMAKSSLLSSPFPSCPARFLFLSPQPPYNTKGPLRRREFRIRKVQLGTVSRTSRNVPVTFRARNQIFKSKYKK